MKQFITKDEQQRYDKALSKSKVNVGMWPQVGDLVNVIDSLFIKYGERKKRKLTYRYGKNYRNCETNKRR